MKELDILSLVRENIIQLSPYSSARDDFEGTASVFLDANENPFPKNYNRYPDPHQKELKALISNLKKVFIDRIFLGNGSDEAIDLLFRVFCEPGQDEVIIPQPTYGMYSVSASINDIKIIPTTLTSSFDLDSSVILKLVSPRTKIIFLCSPNNPSGNLLSAQEVEILLNNFNGIVVIDEAYIDFTKFSGWASRLEEFGNLVILQTFSKAWGIAGLRLGMCFADPKIINLLNKIKSPYNINAFTQTEAIRLLKTGEKAKNLETVSIILQREKLKNELSVIPEVKKIHPSDANFLLVEISDAPGVYNKLVRKGIIVRDRSRVILCDNCLRITVGTDTENELLIQSLKEL